MWRPGPGGLSAAVLLGASVCCLAVLAVQISWMDYARQESRESMMQAGGEAEEEADFLKADGENEEHIPAAGAGKSLGAGTMTETLELSPASIGEEAARYAVCFLGTPYVWGGHSLAEGVDCSGFVMSVYQHFQISLPHSAKEDREAGYEVDGLENAQPGDLICYDNPDHVAIYLGDGKIVHATLSEGVCISRADFGEIRTVRRLLGTEDACLTDR